MTQEKLIYPHKVLTYNAPHSDGTRPVLIDNWMAKGTKMGEEVCHFVSAPGTGRIVYRVTRIDDYGVWGECIEDTSRELTKWDVI